MGTETLPITFDSFDDIELFGTDDNIWRHVRCSGCGAAMKVQDGPEHGGQGVSVYCDPCSQDPSDDDTEEWPVCNRQNDEQCPYHATGGYVGRSCGPDAHPHPWVNAAPHTVAGDLRAMLDLLTASGPMSKRDVARALDLTPAQALHGLRMLRDHGYVTSPGNPWDRGAMPVRGPFVWRVRA